MRRIITLLTDFGWDDHYAGAMKGAILAVNPEAVIVDITHGIPPHSIMEGALALRACCGLFPPGTIHVAVVDPGVGGPRRPLLASSDRHLFLGPDNGLLSLALEETGGYSCREVTARHYFRAELSRTFHGRDVFAPVAAWLSRGIPCERFGEPVREIVRLDIPQPTVSKDGLSGEVIHADRFGNLVTSVTAGTLARFLRGSGGACRLPPDPTVIPLVDWYGAVEAGKPCALVGSAGLLEVAVNGGRAADLFAAGPGREVVVSAS